MLLLRCFATDGTGSPGTATHNQFKKVSQSLYHKIGSMADAFSSVRAPLHRRKRKKTFWQSRRGQKAQIKRAAEAAYPTQQKQADSHVVL
jgi:hypothetical protein